MAHLKKKVLLIDLDPQGHSTVGLGIRAPELPYSIYDVLSPQRVDQIPVREVIRHRGEGLFLLPSDTGLSRIESELALSDGREKRLVYFLERCRRHSLEWDYVILDCPPNLGVLTQNALTAAQEVIIPIEPSFFSLHGLGKISETIKEINEVRKDPLGLHALLTIFDSRTCFAQEVYDEVKKHFKNRMFRSIIHESVLLKEAASAGQSIVEYASDSVPGRDYENLAVEFLEREWDRLLPERELGWKNVVRSIYGPRRVLGGTLFQCQSANASHVEVAGDFNNWVPEPLVRRDRNGLWQKIIPITQGQYRYKFIIDGEWQLDPEHPVTRENAFGSRDSFLELV